MPERRKKRGINETLAKLDFFFSECLKRIYFCEVYWFGSPLILCNIDKGVVLDHYEVLLRDDD